MTTKLQELARKQRPQASAEERCELCAELLPPEHRHLLDLENRQLLCACRACSILFDRSGAGGSHYRLVPDRVRRVEDLDLDDVTWAGFGIPVDMAFFFHSSAAGRVVAFYPSPLGATESLLDLEAWGEVIAANPVLRELEPDVEALLVDRTNGKRDAWLLPVDRCYELVGLIRTYWKGFGGGGEVWEQVGRFFDRLRTSAGAGTSDRKEAAWGSRTT
jgi:Family of unknown function (DUF5947)